MISLQTAENALKDVYLGVMQDTLNCRTDVVLSKIKQTTSDVWGKQICKYTTINGKDFTLKEDLETLKVSFELSDKAIRASQNSAGAFVNLLNNQVENMLKDTQYRLKGSFYTEDKKPEYLPEKLVYEPIKVTGLKKIFDTESETLYGINRKENPEINPVIKTIDGFDPIKIQEIIDNYNDEVNVMICSSKIKRDYMEYQSKHCQNTEIREMDGGYKCYVFNDSLIMVTAKIPDNEIYLLNTEDFKFHQLCDWQWLENSKGNVIQQVSGEPFYKTTLIKYGNYICDKPCKQIKIIVE